LIKQVLNTGLREQIVQATDAVARETLETQLFFINGSRFLLMAVFLGICGLVYVAYRKRMKGGTT
jgi:hypothetical protein